MKLLSYFLLILFATFSHTALAARACVWTPGIPQTHPLIEIPSPNNIYGTNDGKYPYPTDSTFADPTSTRHGSAAPSWSLTCTAPVQVTPLLQTFRPPDTRFSNNWPHLQTTTAYANGVYYYSQEMWYTSPTGEKTWFDGPTGKLNRGAPFILAKDATPSNPVIIRLQDLNIHQIGYQGYQVGNAKTGSFSWGAGGLLHYMRFEMVNYTSTDTTRYNDFYLTLYIDHVNFTVKTCSVILDDIYKNVNLGDRTTHDFSSKEIGAVTPSTEFLIRLRCLPNAAVQYRVNTSTPDTEHDPTNSLGLIKLQGSDPAVGFAVQLRALPFKQASGLFTPVSFGKLVSSSVTATGDAIGNVTSDFIKFDARYYRTKPVNQSTGGSANATATIDINYQ